MSRLSAALSALAATFCAEACGADPKLAGPHDDAAAFLRDEVASMPRHLRLAASFATLVFDYAAIFAHGRPFHALSSERRAAWAKAWAGSPLGPCRELMRFHRSLSVYALYSRLDREAW